MSLTLKIKTVLNLGTVNLWRVLSYRLGLKLGLNPVKRLQGIIDDGDFFMPLSHQAKTSLQPNNDWHQKQLYFGWISKPLMTVPDWHQNCVTGNTLPSANKPWWLIADFNPEIGDIKTVWEASRFDWVLCFAQRACNGDEAALDKLNVWLRDWVQQNPTYCGPNWKCGQEASIRVMHLAIAALITRQHQYTSRPLQQFIAVHLARIVPTLRYAMAQDNNHGTSEAAALFIGGSWLAQFGQKDALRWQNIGRRWLENRARRLIGEDGSFSQYSMSYHRVVLDTYAMAEVWRRRNKLTPFSEKLMLRLGRACQWQHNMPGVLAGDAVNLGANDGARLLPLTDTDYRDFRPSLQLAAALFLQKCAIREEGKWDWPLNWLDIAKPQSVMDAPLSTLFNDGGYATMHQGDVSLLLRYPQFKFRPGQADALHLDFWHAGINVLRDAGTYSYNTDADTLNYFGGTASHNTVQFDVRDQMPRLSRFLLGGWLKPETLSALEVVTGNLTFSVGYCDYLGARHHRQISLEPNRLIIVDSVSGFQQQAVLRWRLIPATWQLEGSTLRTEQFEINIKSDIPDISLALVVGHESRYYLQKNDLPVLEVTAGFAGHITTELHF